jgi:hypothetical protein
MTNKEQAAYRSWIFTEDEDFTALDTESEGWLAILQEEAFDGSFQIADLLVALADALEAATTNSELTVEWSICYASGQVIDKAMTEKKARAMAGQGGTRLIKRTVGPWEEVE